MKCFACFELDTKDKDLLKAPMSFFFLVREVIQTVCVSWGKFCAGNTEVKRFKKLQSVWSLRMLRFRVKYKYSLSL